MRKNSKSSSRLSSSTSTSTSSQSAKLSSCNVTNNIHHGITITDEYAGEIICISCGVVLEEKMSSCESSGVANSKDIDNDNGN